MQEEKHIFGVNEVITNRIHLYNDEITVYGYLLEVVGELISTGLGAPMYSFDVVYMIEAMPSSDDWSAAVESPEYDCRDTNLLEVAIGIKSSNAKIHNGRDVPLIVWQIEEAGYYPYWIGSRFFFKIPAIITGILTATPGEKFEVSLDQITHIRIPEHFRGKSGVIM